MLAGNADHKNTMSGKNFPGLFIGRKRSPAAGGSDTHRCSLSPNARSSAGLWSTRVMTTAALIRSSNAANRRCGRSESYFRGFGKPEGESLSAAFGIIHLPANDAPMPRKPKMAEPFQLLSMPARIRRNVPTREILAFRGGEGQPAAADAFGSNSKFRLGGFLSFGLRVGVG
jgi:hypothetical protein